MIQIRSKHFKSFNDDIFISNILDYLQQNIAQNKQIRYNYHRNEYQVKMFLWLNGRKKKLILDITKSDIEEELERLIRSVR